MKKHIATGNIFADLSEDSSNTKSSGKAESFLTELQQEGKASAKMELGDFEKAIDSMCEILQKDELKKYTQEKEENWPIFKLSLYCHDCRDIVSPGEIKKIRGRSVVFCGVCNSKKISKGKEESLKRFYAIQDKSLASSSK